MEEQRELDQQLGQLDAISKSSDQGSPQSDTADEHVQVPLHERQTSLELVSDNVQALSSAINFHALGKADAGLGKKYVRETVHEVTPSSSSSTHPNTSPEPPTIAFRKRRNPDPPATRASPKRAASLKPHMSTAPKTTVPQPAPGQLSRPRKSLLTSLGLQGPRHHASSRDKFAIPDDQSQGSLSGTPDPPVEPGKLKRGRPAKADATNQHTVLLQPDGLNRKKEEANARRYARLNANKASKGRSTRQKQHEPIMAENESISGTRRPKSVDEQMGTATGPHNDVENSAIREGSTAFPDSPRRCEQIIDEQRSVDPTSTPASSPKIVPESVEINRAEEDYDVLVSEDEVEQAQKDTNRSRGSSFEVVSGHGNDAADAEPSVESNEEGQSSEDEDIAIDSDDGMPDEDIELFGGIRSWDQVLEGAKEVGVSKVKDIETRKRPKISTTTIQELLRVVNNARSFYKEMGSSTSTEVEDQDRQQHLSDLQAEIDDLLGELSEPTEPDQGRLLIQDIYAHAIPAMVFLLRAALLCRTKDFPESDSVESLEEVIHIQASIIQLCEKARRWKAEPVTKRPIKGAVAKKILPYMRDLARYFTQELERRRTLAMRSTLQESLAESHVKMRERIELAKAKRKKEKEDNLKSFCRPLGERPKAMGKQRQQSVHTTRPHPRSQSGTLDNWTEKQNIDLVNQLMRKGIRDLPPEERYLAILNTPSLQNKLPEHIRNRALFYKEDMIADLGPLSYVMSIE